MVDVLSGVVAWAWLAVLAAFLYHFYTRVSVNAEVFRAVFARVVFRDSDWARADKILRASDCPLSELGLFALSLRVHPGQDVLLQHRLEHDGGSLARAMISAKADALAQGVHAHRVAAYLSGGLLVPLVGAAVVGSAPIHLLIAMGCIAVAACILRWGSHYTRRDLRQAVSSMALWSERP